MCLWKQSWNVTETGMCMLWRAEQMKTLQFHEPLVHFKVGNPLEE